MHGAHVRFVTCRDAVTDLVRAGEPFREVEHLIDDLPGVSEEERDALWLLAFALRERPAHGRDLQLAPPLGG